MITGRPREVQHHMRRRLAVKPGIIGLWQINGRSDLPWDEAVRLDLRYVGNWSFASACRSSGRRGPRSSGGTGVLTDRQPPGASCQA